MGIKQQYNDNLRKLPNEYGDVSLMALEGRISGIFVESTINEALEVYLGIQGYRAI